MDNLRGAHDVPWDVKSASLEQFFPPWTVRRQVWSDSLKQQHSGISTDILLFSDINLSLIHHYRIHKHGLSHVAFRGNYMSQLRALLPLPVVQPTDSVLSPVSTGPGSIRQASSAELVVESPRRTRHAKRRMRPVRVVGRSVGDLLVLTIQDPSDVQGAMVYDRRPPLLPVSLQLSDIGPLSGFSTVASASVAVPPWEDGLTISGVGSDGLVVLELGVAPLEGSGTDLEDELLTPDGSPSTDAVKPGEVVIPEVGPAPREVDLELSRALLEVGVLPMMVTPIIDPIPVMSVSDQVPVLVASPLREVGESPVLDQSPSYLVSPPGSVSEPIPSPDLAVITDDVSGPSSGMALMDQYLTQDASLMLVESTDFPFLPAPLTPRQIVEKIVPGSVEGSQAGDPVAVASLSMPDLSREGPFDVHQDTSRSGVLDSLRGCQYRMTAYDEDTSSSEFDPAYGIDLHDLRLLEYVGAPESARLLSRSPEYWLHHMGVMRVAFDREPFPSEAVQTVAPAHRVRRAAHYMAAMGLWRPPSMQGIHGPCRRRRATRACPVQTAFRILAIYDSGVSVFPLGKVRSVVDIVL